MGLRTVGQLAKDAGVTIDTVRYYERIGLLPRRSGAGIGWRRYPDEILARLRYLREGRAVGFTLRELRNLLEVSVAGAPRFCEIFDAAVNEKISAIDTLTARLLAQRARLQEFSRNCRQRRKEQRCPILENLRHRGTNSSGKSGRYNVG
jgi:MerR family copper efflux transcriptional regulator